MLLIIRDILVIIGTVGVYMYAFIHFIPIMIVTKLTKYINKADLFDWLKYDLCLELYLTYLCLFTNNIIYTFCVFIFSLLCINSTLKTYRAE